MMLLSIEFNNTCSVLPVCLVFNCPYCLRQEGKHAIKNKTDRQTEHLIQRGRNKMLQRKKNYCPSLALQVSLIDILGNTSYYNF